MNCWALWESIADMPRRGKRFWESKRPPGLHQAASQACSSLSSRWVLHPPPEDKVPRGRNAAMALAAACFAVVFGFWVAG